MDFRDFIVLRAHTLGFVDGAALPAPSPSALAFAVEALEMIGTCNHVNINVSMLHFINLCKRIYNALITVYMRH